MSMPRTLQRLNALEDTVASVGTLGRIKASDSLQVDPETGEATVPMATETVAGIARQATNAEVEEGFEDGPVFMTPYNVQQKIDTLATDINEGLDGKADANLSNVSAAGKAIAVGWGMPDYDNAVSIASSYTTPCDGYLRLDNGGGNTRWYMGDNVMTNWFAVGIPAGSYGATVVWYPVPKNTSLTQIMDDGNSSFIPVKGAVLNA